VHARPGTKGRKASLTGGEKKKEIQFPKKGKSLYNLGPIATPELTEKRKKRGGPQGSGKKKVARKGTLRAKGRYDALWD